jgi:hypothetical protein
VCTTRKTHLLQCASTTLSYSRVALTHAHKSCSVKTTSSCEHIYCNAWAHLLLRLSTTLSYSRVVGMHLTACTRAQHKANTPLATRKYHSVVTHALCWTCELLTTSKHASCIAQVRHCRTRVLCSRMHTDLATCTPCEHTSTVKFEQKSSKRSLC